MTPVESPRSSAYSRIVFRRAPSLVPRTASSACDSTPLCVLRPVTMAVMPAAESVTQLPAADVSISAMLGIFWMNSACGRS